MTPAPATEHALGRRAIALLDALSQYSDDPARLTRLYLSPAHRAAAEATLAFMRAAGLESRIDPLGSVVGRLEGQNPDRPALIIGSHIDTVVDAGRYDGTLGVVLGIVAVEALRERGIVPACPIEIIAFGDEENARFPTNLSTAYALSGRYDLRWLDGVDQDGLVLRDALRAFGGDASQIASVARRPEDYRGYLEVHIEQGPQLQAQDLPVGIVSAINGVSRARVTVTGEAGHAGTVPMDMRRDALAATAEMILAIETIGGKYPGTVATVGAAQIEPGAVNVIPARVVFTLDARSPDDTQRHAMVRQMTSACEAIAQRRKVDFDLKPFMDSPATAMDSGLMAVLDDSLSGLHIPPVRLASGAGHDAVAMAALCPTAMLFVRCKDGISHNPAESITVADADVAARVLIDTVTRLVA
ncbi:allantoate amidohydrolase [Microvirga antarctica]|uniref:allantoate amidohydrolase n=1 Tax=Microvirga antarctica TaxID=2819233 RepID=UPI001B3087CC|nr:allantoate amidohydrolase [Microvirga antarctica]